MGVFKYILVISVAVGVLGVVIHEVYPQYIVSLMKDERVRSATMVVHNFFRDLYPKAETKSDLKTTKEARKNKEKLFTVEELAKYDGREGRKGPFLAILGRVYNVKKGKQHYGPGGGYEFFAGRDGSRAFVSGDFSEAGLVDDVTGLTAQDYIGLDDWIKFYEKDYKFMGKLIGRFYTERGEETEYLREVRRWTSEAYSAKESESAEKQLFPPCNTEWSHDTGSRVWCTTKSGGVSRDWTGVPRKYYRPGQARPRCACIKNFGAPSHDPSRTSHDGRGDLDNPHVEEYDGCPPDHTSCYIKVD